MPNVNKVILIGHLTKDPLVKYLPNQTALAEFGIAVNRRFKSASGEEREEVAFVDCVCFGKGAEVLAQYTQKGRALYIEGRLKYDSWDDKQSGAKRSKLSVVVENFQFIGGRDDVAADETTDQRRPPARAGAGGTRRTAVDQLLSPRPQDDDMSDIPFAWRDARRPA